MHLSPSWGLYIKLLPHCRLVQLKFSVLTPPPLLELLNDYIHPHTFVIIQYHSLYLHFLVYLTCYVHLHFYLQPPTPFYSLILIFTTSLLHITPFSLTLYSTHYIITDMPLFGIPLFCSSHSVQYFHLGLPLPLPYGSDFFLHGEAHRSFTGFTIA